MINRSLRDQLQAVMDGRANPAPILTTLGMKLLEYGNGKAAIGMEVGKKFHNPMGTLHGGIITDLADATMGIALISTLDQNETFTTVELKMNFIRPVYSGKIRAEGGIVHRGRTIAVAEGFVANEEGRQVARGVATQMILKVK